MSQKKTFLVLGSAFILQVVAYILLDIPFPNSARDIASGLVFALLQGPEAIVRSLSFTSDSFLWSIMPWLLAGLIGGLASRSPRKGAIGALLATILALALFIVLFLFLVGIELSILLNTHGYTMVVGFITAAILAGIGGVMGGTLTQK